MRPRWSSSSSSETSPERLAGAISALGSGPEPASAREVGPVRYRARVSYDGTEFAGFQFQPGFRTVQGVLEEALSRVAGPGRCRVEGAGRTDAGVHASGQVVSFVYPGRLSRARLARSLDALLPRDVALGPLQRVDPGFSARREAVQRQYRYTVWNGPRDPLRERFALGVRTPLDDRAMEEAAQAIVGRHDFSAYGGHHRQPIRTLHALRVRRQGRTVTIDVIGDAFLRQMVRSIVAALLRVGRGEVTGTEVQAALQAPTRAFAGEVAPAAGLCLRRVTYPAAGRKRNGA